MKNLLFLSCLVLFITTSCEKEQIVVPINNKSLGEVNMRTDDDCVFNDDANETHVFDYCGTAYVFQGELRIVNNEHSHYIQAIGKCHKLGDPSSIVDNAEIKVEVWGDAHIWCQIPQNVNQATDYSENLVAGEVPSTGFCENCGKETVTIQYVKNITLTDEDIIKAEIRLSLDGCGEPYEDTIFLDL